MPPSAALTCDRCSMDELYHLSTLFVLVTIVAHFESSAFSILSIDPTEVEVLVNSKVEVTCSIKSNTTNWTYVDLGFKYVFGNGSTLSVDSNYVDKVNESAIEFFPPFLHSEFNGSYISCYTPNDESLEARVSIWEPHPTPEITSYEMQNWEKLRFEWGFNGANLNRNMPAVFRGWYKDSNAKEFTMCDADSGVNECSVRKSPSEIAPFAGIVHIKVNGTNRLESISTDGLLFPLSQHIRPGSVKSLIVRHVPENYSTCYAVFGAPHRESMMYNISTSCNYGRYQKWKIETPVKFSEIRTNIPIILDDLPADTDCSLSVNARPTQGGFWGPVEKFIFHTLEAVPIASPSVCRSCFDLRTTDDENFRNVVIYFEPLSRGLARGIVTSYKVQYMDSQTKLTQLLNSSSFMIELQNFSISDDYHVTVEAGTAVGFNRSLPIPVLTIKMHSLFDLKIEKFTVIAINETEVSVSWEPLHNASGYTLFWCRKTLDKLLCSDVLHWIELPPNYSSHEISLASGDHSRKCMVGIGFTQNGINSGIQWTDFVYDIQAAALPPSFELISAFAFELHLCLKKTLPLSGFVVKNVIYFCPVSSEDDLECTGAFRQIVVSGWSSEVHLTGLSPDQRYKILGESWTAAGRSLHNSTVVLMTSASDVIAAWLIAVIVFGVLICLCVILVGLFTIIRFYRRSVVRYKQWLSIGIKTPPGPAADLESDRCRTENVDLGIGYVDVAASSCTPASKRTQETVADQTEIECIEEPFHMDILPNRYPGVLGDIPLYTEERLLPPISRLNIHGSSPSIMLHVNRSVTSLENKRILPSIRGKPVYIKPLQRNEDTNPEAIPMVFSEPDGDNLKENCADVSDAESTMSYAYARQRNSWGGRFIDSAAAPVKFSEMPEESGNDYSTGENEGDEDDGEDEEDERISKTIEIGEGFTSGKTSNSFEHLPPLTNSLC